MEQAINLMPKILSICIVLLLSTQATWAVKMATSVKEALYLFEIKGEFSKAVKILENVINVGDADDKNNAYFYLAKIQDLSGNASIASLYYTQSLMETKNPSDAYWISEQLARLSPEPEKLIEQSFLLKSPIYKYFNTPSDQYFLLENREIIQINKGVRSPVTAKLPSIAQIHSIAPNGIWYSNTETQELFFQPLQSKTPTKTYPLKNKVDDLFALPANQALVVSGNDLFLATNEGIRFSIKNQYNGCTLVGFYEFLNRFVINCPDNALHFIQIETGQEDHVISQLDPITHVQLEPNGVLIASGHSIWFYKPDENTPLIWKYSNVNIEDLVFFEKNIAFLETSGKVTFLDKKNGFPISSMQSDASWIFPMATGSLGLFSKEGNIIAVDTVLRPLWKFHLGIPFQEAPFKVDDKIYAVLTNRTVLALNALHYGKKPLLSTILVTEANRLASRKQWKELSPLLDSLLQIEPGNAEGWFLKALLAETLQSNEKEKQKAWTEAVRLSSGVSQKSSLILSRYSKMIGAKFTQILQLSPKTSYPQFFGNKKNLYTVDVAAQTLQNINSETGEVRWVSNLGKLASSPVMANDETSLAIASGFKIHVHELLKEGGTKTFELPGKPFHIEYTNNAIYISTWNGFLVKLLKPNLDLAWSRKIFTMPFHFTAKGNDLFVASLEGEVLKLWHSSGQIKQSVTSLQTTITHLEAIDSLVSVTNADNKIFLYSTNSNELLKTITTPSDITSLQFVENSLETQLLIGLSNQEIALYTAKTGSLIWNYSGTRSVFVTPVVHNGIAWIDQGSEVIGISINTGKVEHRFKTPGGASSPFIIDKTIFTASSKRLLYAFSLPF